MSLHDFNLANQTPASYRTDHNNLNTAIGTNSYSTQSPTTTMQAMSWADATSSGWQRQRSTADSTWHYLYKLDAQGGLCTYSGNPSTNHIGRFVGQTVWDTANNYPYWCTLAGTSSQATWSRPLLSTEAAGLPALYHGGPPPKYLTTTTLRIPGGYRCRDDSNAADITFSSNYTIDITVSGAGGLSTDLTASTSGMLYYLFAIRKSGDGTVNGILTNSSSGPVLPSGYDQKRMIPFFVRYTTQTIFQPFVVAEGWPFRPRIKYIVDDGYFADVKDHNILSAGGTTSYASHSLTTYVPPFARLAELKVAMVLGSAGGFYAAIRETGSTWEGKFLPGRTDFSTDSIAYIYDQYTSTSQSIDLKVSDAEVDVSIWVTGCTITELTTQ